MKSSCDLSPALAHLRHEALDLEALFGADGLMVEGRLQVLVVAFSALLW